MMKSFIFALLISISFPVHAGDLIILEKYRLEKKENKISSMDAEREQELAREKLKNTEDRREREWGRERREANSDTQLKVNERRKIQNFTIRRIDNKHNIVDTDEDNSLLEYQF